MDHTTDWYCICLLLELFLNVLRRVFTPSNTQSDYKATLISDLHITMSVLVLPTHYLRSIFAHKSANPFYPTHPPLSPPYLVACCFVMVIMVTCFQLCGKME